MQDMQVGTAGDVSLALDVRAPELPVAEPPELVVSADIDSADLGRLLMTVGSEDCAHSWRNVPLGARPTLDALVDWENRRRPTRLMFFYSKRGWDVRFVAAATVAEKLTHDFPYDGFPVLGRCYVMPEFRGLGLYRRILGHRLAFCQDRFGDKLRAVHLGTRDARISHAVSRSSGRGWPRFVHLGQEELHVAGDVTMVDDFLHFAPAYVRRLTSALEGPDAPAAVTELRRRLKMIDVDTDGDLAQWIRSRFDAACSVGWFDGRDSSEFERLFAFCRSIPLLAFR